jgi:hypothetical protein
VFSFSRCCYLFPDEFAAYIPDGDVGRYAAGLAAQLRQDFTGTMSLLRDPQFQDLLVNYPRAPRTFYLGAQLNLAEFKTKVDGINKRNAFWGFKGPKGQMFFNMVVSVADDRAKCDQEIKAAIKA